MKYRDDDYRWQPPGPVSMTPDMRSFSIHLQIVISEFRCRRLLNASQIRDVLEQTLLDQQRRFPTVEINLSKSIETYGNKIL